MLMGRNPQRYYSNLSQPAEEIWSQSLQSLLEAGSAPSPFQPRRKRATARGWLGAAKNPGKVLAEPVEKLRESMPFAVAIRWGRSLLPSPAGAPGNGELK